MQDKKFFIISLLPTFLRLAFQPLISVKTGFQWLEPGSQVGSTTDHILLLHLQHPEDLNMIRAELTGVIAKRLLMR